MMRTRYMSNCRSIGALFLRPLPHGRVLNNVADKLESFQSIARSEGDSIRGRVSFTNPLAVKIVHALQLGDRSRASNLLSNVSSGNHVLCADDFEYIIGYCARRPDPAFVMETWKIIKERNDVSNKCYLQIIRALCNAGYLEEAFALVKFIGDNFQTNDILSLYNTLLLASIKNKDVKHTCQCLDLMDSQMMGKNQITYYAHIKLASWQNDLPAVFEIWREYCKYYNMNIVSLRKFVQAFASMSNKSGRDVDPLQHAYTTLQQMVALALKGEVSLSTTTEGKIFCPQLDIPIPSKNQPHPYNYNFPVSLISIDDVEKSTDTIGHQPYALNDAERLKSETIGISTMEEHKRAPIVKLLRWSFNDVLQACANHQNSTLAEQLVLQMQNLGVEPSSRTYDGLVKAIMSERGYRSGLQVLNLMQERSIKPCDSTLTRLSVACSRALELDLAESLLSEASKCSRVDHYNAFLAACQAMGQPDRAVRMLTMMNDRGIKLNIETYELLFSLFVNVNAPYEEGNMWSQADAASRVKAIEMHMLDNGIQHSQRSLSNLLKALGAEGMIKELIQYLQLAEHQLSIQDTALGIDTYNNVLHSLVDAKQSHMAVEIFKSMKKNGYLVNITTYNIMIDCCSNIICFKSASALVSMMIRDGFLPQTSTYTVLIKILLKASDFDRALSLLHKAFTDGTQPDVLLFNTFLNKASTEGRIDIIELIVELMHEWRIQPDPSSCQYVFSAYIEGGFSSTALEALEVLSLRMISEDKTILQEKRAEFEECISSDDNIEVQIMKLLNDSYDTDNICFALLNLRWCVILGSTLSWEPNQSPWAKRLSTTSKEYGQESMMV